MNIFSLHSLRMKQKSLCFGENYIIKNSFYKDTRPVNIYEVDIKKKILSDKELYGNKTSFKYLIGYIHKGFFFQHHYV